MPKPELYDELFNCIVAALRQRLTKSHAEDLVAIVMRSKQLIIAEYEAVSDAVKDKYMKGGLECSLDRHKYGACFMVAFENGLYIDTDLERYEIYREEVAIHAGLTVLGTFIIGDALNSNSPEIIGRLKANGGFVIPEPVCDELPYKTGWALRLRNACFNNQGIDVVLFIADGLFWIEEYNRKLS